MDPPATDEPPIPSVSRRKLLSTAGIGLLGWVGLSQAGSPNLRQSVLMRLDPIARRYGSYASYRLSTREFIGEIHEDDLDVGDLGYEHNPLAAVKYHPETERTDDDSWRRIDDEHPRWQWHVHLWVEDEIVEVFSHYEYRPDPWPLDGESTSDMRQRLRDHYNPRWDTSFDEDEANYFLGEASDELLAVLTG